MTVDRGTKRANQQGNLTAGRNGTAVQFFFSLLIGYRKTAGMSSLREDTPADSTAKNHAPRQKTLGASLIPRLLRSDFSTRNASEDLCIGHCIAPNAVRAVDAAGDFARCVEAFNGLAVDIHHVRLGVDLQAAHRMVNRWRHDRRPVRTFIQTVLGQAGAAAELVALLYLAELIPRGNRLLEILGVDAGSLGKIVKRLADKRLVLTQKIRNLDAVGIAPVLIRQIRLCGRDDIENVVLLYQASLGKHIAAFEFIDKAVAVLVDVNARALGHLVVGCAGIRISRRQQLDVAHVDSCSSQLERQVDAVAGDRRQIRGLDLFIKRLVPERVVLLAYGHIGSETARSQNDAVLDNQILSRCAHVEGHRILLLLNEIKERVHIADAGLESSRKLIVIFEEIEVWTTEECQKIIEPYQKQHA